MKRNALWIVDILLALTVGGLYYVNEHIAIGILAFYVLRGQSMIMLMLRS
ncbi:hypothetical protein LCGC14_0918280 [marine sediment metagenome]|uniref:Uncharacterized protein n=1 Tax=marine sediment metagenome TaxID=412755 RepID=A0A0F9RA72_9ZZZZ